MAYSICSVANKGSYLVRPKINHLQIAERLRCEIKTSCGEILFPLSYTFSFIFFQYFIQHCFICHPSDCAVSEDAGIEPRTLAMVVRRSNV
jgi:hypothetical protein